MRRIVFLDLKEAPVPDLGSGGPRGSRVTEEEDAETGLAKADQPRLGLSAGSPFPTQKGTVRTTSNRPRTEGTVETRGRGNRLRSPVPGSSLP